jgi:hypothetical protein
LVPSFRLEQLVETVDFAHLSVVAGGDAIRAERQRVVEKGPELDLRVAQHVGVGRAAGPVVAEKSVEHALLVLGGEIDDVDIHADGVGDGDGRDQVLPRRAVVVGVVVLPVLHEEAGNLVPLLLQQQGGDGRVDAARHADNDAFPGHFRA